MRVTSQATSATRAAGPTDLCAAKFGFFSRRFGYSRAAGPASELLQLCDAEHGVKSLAVDDHRVVLL
jgi:hypothetical protein